MSERVMEVAASIKERDGWDRGRMDGSGNPRCCLKYSE